MDGEQPTQGHGHPEPGAGKGFPGTSRFALSASLHRFSSPANPLLQEGPFNLFLPSLPGRGEERVQAGEERREWHLRWGGGVGEKAGLRTPTVHF